jgi:hypothetical protein
VSDLAGLIELVEKAEDELVPENALRILAMGQGKFVCTYLPHRGDDGSDEYTMLVDQKNGRVRVHVPERDLPDRSTDAAVALLERVLPSWYWRVGKMTAPHWDRERGIYRPFWAHIQRTHADHCDREDEATGYAQTAPLAILLALLKAIQMRQPA